MEAQIEQRRVKKTAKGGRRKKKNKFILVSPIVVSVFGRKARRDIQSECDHTEDRP